MAILVVSCSGVDHKQEDLRREGARNQGVPSQCPSKNDAGCIVGQVVVSPWISLQGTDYFDADALGQNLMLHAHALFGQKVHLKGVQGLSLEVQQRIDNDNFTHGFYAYIKGERARSVKVSRNGGFMLPNLPSGFYDLVVQKRISLKDKAKPSSNQNETINYYCLTIYSEKQRVFLDEGQELYLGFDDYMLTFAGRPCQGRPGI